MTASAAIRDVARDQNFLRQPPEVLDERDLENARPGPQLADRQRRHRLIAVHEADELRLLETAVAVPQELERHRVDPRVTGNCRSKSVGQLAIVAVRQVLANGADLGLTTWK